MKTKLFALLAIIALSVTFVGCTPSEREVPGINAQSLQQEGSVVGTLPDGRDVKRWSVWSPDGNHVHYIYVVEAATSVSTNRLEAQGKTQVNRTDVVIINGKKYVPEK